MSREQDRELRECGHCGRRWEDNHLPDPCLGNLAGVTNACCGHGDPTLSYICFNGGLVLKGFAVAHEHHRPICGKEAGLITGHNEARREFATRPGDAAAMSEGRE